MAARVGRDGFIGVSSSAGGTSDRGTYFDSWSVSPSVGTADISYYGANSKEFAHTMREWTASISGTFDGSDTQQAIIRNIFATTSQAALYCRFYLTSTESFRGTVLPTGYSVNNSLTDKVSWTCDLQGTSNLTFSATGA